MKVWVDADACPNVIAQLISRAVHRNKIETLFVANKPLVVAESPYISFVQVSSGPDVADVYIAERATAGDIVVTQDVPLAALLVPKKVTVITPRGQLFNEGNINEALAGRDLMQSLRDTGTISGGPSPLDERHKREFANHFDAAIHRQFLP